MTKQTPKTILACCVVILLTAAGLLPLMFPGAFEPATDAGYHGLFKILLLFVPIGVVAICYRIKIDCPPGQKAGLFVLLISLTLLLVYVHYIYVDTTALYFHEISNHDWQLTTHRHVITLDPASVPHSYRFLPYSIVRIVEFLTGDFSYARSLYRVTFTFLLVFGIYYYARIYYNHEKALLAILLYAAVYPVSIRCYAGQLTDPLSHVSFVLAFIFLELNLFACFLLASGIGIMAKESILVMIVYFLIFRRKESNYRLKAGLALITCIAITMIIRLWIVPGQSSVNDVFVLQDLRGTALPHLINNLRKFPVWSKQILLTVGIFIPFLILGWRNASSTLRSLAVFLLATLLLSNLFFGWLSETRNLMPAVIPLALITSHCLLSRGQKPG